MWLVKLFHHNILFHPRSILSSLEYCLWKIWRTTESTCHVLYIVLSIVKYQTWILYGFWYCAISGMGTVWFFVLRNIRHGYCMVFGIAQYQAWILYGFWYCAISGMDTVWFLLLRNIRHGYCMVFGIMQYEHAYWYCIIEFLESCLNCVHVVTYIVHFVCTESDHKWSMWSSGRYVGHEIKGSGVRFPQRW